VLAIPWVSNNGFQEEMLAGDRLICFATNATLCSFLNAMTKILLGGGLVRCSSCQRRVMKYLFIH
jgi:hypothetical protein